MNIDEISDDEILKLDNQICFALYVSSKEIIRKYKPLLDPLNLTYTGYITMMALWERDDISVRELGKRLYLDSGTLTPLLKKLESIGYITRKRDSGDERRVTITLTSEGRELKKRAAHVPRELICSSDFDETSGIELLRLLHSHMPRRE